MGDNNRSMSGESEGMNGGNLGMRGEVLVAAKCAKRKRDEDLAAAAMLREEHSLQASTPNLGDLYRKLYERLVDLEIKVEEQQDELDERYDEIDKLRKHNVELEARIVKLETAAITKSMETETVSIATTWRDKLIGKKKEELTEEEKKIQKEQIKEVNDVVEDARERERRKNNVVIFGLPESNAGTVEEKRKDDETKIKALITELAVKVKVKRIIRHKSKPNTEKPAVVVIELDSERERNSMLYSAKKLKNSQNNKKIFLSTDMTMLERARFNSLRDEAKEKNATETGARWVVRNNKLVKLTENNRQ